MKLSRRTMLKTMGTGVLAAGLGIKLSMDAPLLSAQAVSPAAAFYRTALGDFEITVIRDAVSTMALGTLVANAEADEANALLAANGFREGDQPNNVKQLLVNTGSELVLFDTGLGAEFSQLMPTLELIGVAPEDITTVVISHWHPDHIGGVAPGGVVAFPNAQYVMAQAEYDLLQSDSGNQGFQGALNTLQPVVDAGQLAFYNPDDEIITGIQAVTLPGHTPNHSGFEITSGGLSLMNTVDAIIHPVVSVQQTGWHFGFDADREQAVATRRAALSRIASEDMLIFGYHFPFPGIGVIAEGSEENSFRYTPLSY